MFVVKRSSRKPQHMEDAEPVDLNSDPLVEEPEIFVPTAVAEPATVDPVPEVVPVVPVSLHPEPAFHAKKPRRNYLEFDTVAHFPDLPTKTARCVGMGHYLSDAQRQKLNPGFVLAIPEPTNRHDANAIVIADPAGRKLGYLSAGQAKSYAPLIQALGALQLDCRRDGIKLWIDLPNLPALRKRVADQL